MKLAFVLTQLEAGGAQNRVMQTAQLLRQRGHEVDVYFLYRKRDAFAGQPMVVLTEHRGVTHLVQATARLVTQLKSGKYDAVIANTAIACTLGCTAALLAGIRNRIAVQTQVPAKRPWAYNALDLLAGLVGIYRVNVANSYWTASLFEKYPARYRRRMRVVPNGVSPRVSELTQEQARDALQIPQPDFVFVTVGRLSPQKNQAVLLQALKHVPGAILVIVGEGELRAHLTALAESESVSDRVVFAGEVSSDIVAHYLRAADTYVFPSGWETFGLATVEAASAGLPLIVSDLPVHREVIGNATGEGAPVFVSPGDVEGWSVAMRSSMDRSAEDLAGSRASGRLIAETHSLGTHADRLLAVLDS